MATARAALDQLSDEQLAALAAREGSDGQAFVALEQRFRERVWNVCFRLLSNETDAQDAAQDVFVQLFLQRAKFRGESKYSTWVHAIAVRTCLMARRGRGRRQRREGAPSGADLDVQAATKPAPPPGARLDLDTMLDVLDEEDRALIIMKYAAGHDYEELAEIFGLSVSACKMRISRAREKIQARFGTTM